MKLQSGEVAIFVFSAAQPVNEVAYTMKTEYIPRLKRHLRSLSGLSPMRHIKHFFENTFLRGGGDLP